MRGEKRNELLEQEHKLKGSSFKKVKGGQKEPEMEPGVMATQHSSEPAQCQ